MQCRIGDLIETYKKTKCPIPISFREEVKPLNSPERATHLIHPYPAKLLMHIPYFFLDNTILSKAGDTILDPFCGSGTVLLEALLSGRNALGADANPLARLISKVKVTPLDHKCLKEQFEQLLKLIPQKPTIPLPDVINLTHWFYPQVIEQLLCLLEGINKVEKVDIKDFLLVCFSNCVRKVSLADPRLSVPVKLRYGQYPDGHRLREKTDQHLRNLQQVNVSQQFLKTFETNYNRMISMEKLIPKTVNASVICSDSRNLEYKTKKAQDGTIHTKKVRSESIDLIITSPPYVGAQKYIRASSLNLGWLGLCGAKELNQLNNLNIGRENYPKDSYRELVSTGIKEADNLLKQIRSINSLRAHIAGIYLLEMREAFQEIFRVLKRGGYMVLIAANNQICEQEFYTQEFLRYIAENIGFSLILRLIDDIRSRGLMTKRNRTASIITKEWILVFQKG